MRVLLHRFPQSSGHRGVLAALACGFFGVTASAQQVTIAPLLKSGDEFTLRVTRVRENSSRPEQNAKTTMSVEVRVMSATADGFALDWVPGESRIESGQAAQDPLLLAAANALRGLQLRLMLNADGEYTGLANQKEVASQVQNAANVVVQAVMEKVPAEQRAGMQKLFAQVLSPAVLLGTVTRDAQTYFNLNGLSLAVGKTVAVDLEHPNPLGGGVLPATYRVTMESATSDSAVLTTATTYDAAALLQATRALLEQSGKPVPDSELATMPALQMTDDGRFVLDRRIGLMQELIVNRRLTAGKDERLDRWEIQLVRAPQR